MSRAAAVISRVLVRSGYAGRCMRDLRAGLHPALTVLAYHRIGQAVGNGLYPHNLSAAPGGDGLDARILSATPAGFDWQMDFLQRNFCVISWKDCLAHLTTGRALPPNAALITFDDGYRDNYELAYPILARRGLPALIFPITSKIGTREMMWWDEVAFLLRCTLAEAAALPGLDPLRLETPRQRKSAQEKIRRLFKTLTPERREAAMQALRSLPRREDALPERTFFSWDEAREMQRGGISFGAHTHTHPILTRLPLEQARAEIDQSRQVLRRELGEETSIFAYPNGRAGDYNGQTRALLSELGFRVAFTLEHGSTPLDGQPVDWLSLRRIYIGSDDRAVFTAKVSGALERAAAFARLGRGGRR